MATAHVKRRNEWDAYATGKDRTDEMKIHSERKARSDWRVELKSCKGRKETGSCLANHACKQVLKATHETHQNQTHGIVDLMRKGRYAQ